MKKTPNICATLAAIANYLVLNSMKSPEIYGQ